MTDDVEIVNAALRLIGRPPSMTRAKWKIYYRAERVRKREFNKMFIDMMMFGFGGVLCMATGEVSHIAAKDLYWFKEEKRQILGGNP